MTTSRLSTGFGRERDWPWFGQRYVGADKRTSGVCLFRLRFRIFCSRTCASALHTIGKSKLIPAAEKQVALQQIRLLSLAEAQRQRVNATVDTIWRKSWKWNLFSGIATSKNHHLIKRRNRARCRMQSARSRLNTIENY